MSNKTQLQTNNTQLASLIQTLQDKAAGGGSSGGGASVETCTVTMNAGRKVPGSSTFYYVSESGLATGSTPTSGATAQIQCMKPSLLVRILGYSTIDIADGEANNVVSAQAYDVIYINGDTTISVNSI